MKVLIFSLLILGQAQLFASEFSECVETVDQSCGRFVSGVASYATKGPECSILKGDDNKSSKAVFEDETSVFVVDLKSCNYSEYQK